MIRTLALALALIGSTFAADAAAPAAAAKAYPIDTCLVSGEKIPAKDAPAVTVDGQEYKFCCEKCVAKFKADPKAYAAKLAEAVKAEKKDAPAATPAPAAK